MIEFNFKSQICTDKAQSERLSALGLKPETADMCWVLADEDREGNKYSVEYMSIGQGKYQLLHPDWYIPAWSLHRLLSLLPDYIVVNSSSGLNPNFYLNIRDGFVSYKDNRGFSYGSTSVNMYDAITRMISFLIKEGYFNKEYLCES